jgi:starvation-inducible DNA-binding protein
MREENYFHTKEQKYVNHHMYPIHYRIQKQVLPEEQQAKLIELLNRRLADTIDLMLQTRQAYWNVKGPHFIALRELFNRVVEGVEEDANLIAERIVQLGGMAEGTAQAVARRSSLDEYWLSTTDGNGHIDALSTTLAAFGKHIRYASEQATELKDADTAAIFTEIARGIDKWLWFVETSQQTES